MKVYISGSISKNPNYKDEFQKAESEVRSIGYDVINPAKNSCESYKDYIDKGLRQLSECDMIYMLKGYEESDGAMLELQYAITVGMDIIYE